MQQMLALSSARILLARLGAMLLSRQQVRQTNVVSWCEGRGVYGNECLVDTCVPPWRCQFEMVRAVIVQQHKPPRQFGKLRCIKFEDLWALLLPVKHTKKKEDMKPSHHMYTT